MTRWAGDQAIPVNRELTAWFIISVGFDGRHLALISHRCTHILGTSCHFSVQYSVDNSGNVFSRFSTDARCKTTCKYFFIFHMLRTFCME